MSPEGVLGLVELRQLKAHSALPWSVDGRNALSSGKGDTVDGHRAQSAHGRGISRRTVAKGIAWSVPAVVVASAAPAYALSSASPTVGVPDSCKNPGVSCNTRPKGYSFFVPICNPDPT